MVAVEHPGSIGSGTPDVDSPPKSAPEAATAPTPRTTAADPDAAGRPAVVLLSGGLDSATTLAIAREQGFRCHGLLIEY